MERLSSKVWRFYVPLVLALVFLLFPFYWMLVTTFKSDVELYNLSINPFYSRIIPGPDDGKVAVESARVEGAADFLVLPATHTFIMNRTDVADATIHFLETGRFRDE